MVENNSSIDNSLNTKLINKYGKKYTISNAKNSKFKLIGTTDYRFMDSKRTKDRKICTLIFSYKIIDTSNNKIIKTDKISINGTGFSKETAKQNAIEKLIL